MSTLPLFWKKKAGQTLLEYKSSITFQVVEFANVKTI
jgi:hypothetical protein